MEKNRKNNNYWDSKENCRIAALDCKTKTEFKHKYYQAWYNCRKYNWTEELCSHFESKQVEHGYWQSKKKCEEVALLCSTRTEFQNKYPQAYRVSHENGWDKEYNWFLDTEELKRLHHPSLKWTYESCYEEAKKYKTRSEFQRENVAAYNASWKKGWIKDYFWLVDGRVAKLDEEIDNVYAYEFPDFNSVYVGRTIDIQRRDTEHRSLYRKEINDTVLMFAKENNVDVPKIKIVERCITIKEGVIKEGEWVEKYSKNGWNILNKKETGGIGTIAFGKWNRTTCYEEAKKYKTRKEFKLKSSSAYKRAWKNGWLSDYTWFVNGHKKENWFVWKDAS